MDPCTSRTALPKYGPSSYSVTPNRKPARAYWRCSRRANATAVTMITTLTGVSQAGRRPPGQPVHRLGTRERKSWQASRSRLASPSTFWLFAFVGSPFADVGRRAEPGACGGGGHRPAHSGSYRPEPANRLIVA